MTLRLLSWNVRRLLSWNVRGLNNPQKREVCKNLLKEWKCDIVWLQETKVSSINVAFVRSLWGLNASILQLSYIRVYLEPK